MNDTVNVILNGEWSDLPIVDHLRVAGRAACEFLTESDTMNLLVLAFILHCVGRYLVGTESRLRTWSKSLAYFSFLGFFIRDYIEETPSEVPDLVAIGFRSFVASYTIFGILTIVLPIIALLWSILVVWPYRIVRKLKYSVQQRLADWRWRARRRREERRLRRAQRRMPSRVQYLRQAAGQARADFTLDCELIQSADLDADERESVLLDAKRRLVRRLHHILQ